MYIQGEYIGKCEKAGIPTFFIIFEDQEDLTKQTGLREGIPNWRYFTVPRTGTGDERVDTFYNALVKSFTTPLTDKEKETGLYNPAGAPRVCFEGTLDEAQEFYQRTTMVDACGPCPIAMWTDGLPVIIPTEEKVAEMLTGTSHKSTELLVRGKYTARWSLALKEGDPLGFWPMKYNATVEKVAINCVMAGCKPEYLPIVLAMTPTCFDTGSTHFQNYFQVVSGPIAKEIGMNAYLSAMGPQNRANAAIGRAYQMCSINLGGQLVGVNRLNTMSLTGMGGCCFAENFDKMPPGWVGLNEESGFKKTESVVICNNTKQGFSSGGHSPGAYRDLQIGGGSMALRIGVTGNPYPNNWLEFVKNEWWVQDFGQIGILMQPEMALALQAFGFKSKSEIYKWIWDQSFITMYDMKRKGWYDFSTNAGKNIEPFSKKPYNELPDDFKIPANGGNPNANYVIVVGGEEEQSVIVYAGRGDVFPIDPWR